MVRARASCPRAWAGQSGVPLPKAVSVLTAKLQVWTPCTTSQSSTSDGRDDCHHRAHPHAITRCKLHAVSRSRSVSPRPPPHALPRVPWRTLQRTGTRMRGLASAGRPRQAAARVRLRARPERDAQLGPLTGECGISRELLSLRLRHLSLRSTPSRWVRLCPRLVSIRMVSQRPSPWRNTPWRSASTSA